MTFNPNIPLPTDLLSVSQGDLKANNIALDASFGINHVPFSTATNNGKHNFVEMPVRTLIPAPLAVGEGTIYTKTVTSAELFYTNGISANEYRLTRVIPASFSQFGTSTALPSLNGNGGWTFIAGGLLLQYGSFNPNTGTTVQFPIAFTGIPFSVQLTGSASNNSTFRAGVSTGTLTNAQFVFEGTVNAAWTPIYFIAIGI